MPDEKNIGMTMWDFLDKRFRYILGLIVLILSLTYILLAAGYRIPVELKNFVTFETERCSNFKGQWLDIEKRGLKADFSVDDSVLQAGGGCKLTGKLETSGFFHAFEGTVVGSNATVKILRTRKTDACSTTMFGRFSMVSSDAIYIIQEIIATDKTCDLPSDFNSTVVYKRI